MTAHIATRYTLLSACLYFSLQSGFSSFLADPLHRLRGDPQPAGGVLGRTADQRAEHESLEAVGVGGLFPLERRDGVLAVVAPRTAMEGGRVDPEAGLAPDVEVPDRLG